MLTQKKVFFYGIFASSFIISSIIILMFVTFAFKFGFTQPTSPYSQIYGGEDSEYPVWMGKMTSDQID